MLGFVISAVLAATPANLASVAKGAHGGDTVACVGQAAQTGFTGLSFDPPLTLDMTGCTLVTLRLQNNWGLNVVGQGHFIAAAVGSASDGIYVLGGRNINISGQTFDLNRASKAIQLRMVAGGSISQVIINHPGTGIYIEDSQDISLSEVSITDYLIDGLDIASSLRVTVDGLICRAYTRSAGAHADCAQLWNVAGKAQTADIEIKNSAAMGPTQAWTAFRSGTGYDRINIHHNFSNTTVFPTGTQLIDARSSTVRNNTFIGGGLKLADSPTISPCGNIIANATSRVVQPPCPADAP